MSLWLEIQNLHCIGKWDKGGKSYTFMLYCGSASIARRIKLRYRLLSYDNGRHYELLTVGNYKTKKKKKSEIPKGTITWPIKAIKLMLILN